MLRNIRIGLRASLFFGLLGALTLLLGVFSIAQQRELSSISNEFALERIPQITLTGEMRRDLLSTRLYAATFAINDSAENRKTNKERIEKSNRSFTEVALRLQKLVTSEKGTLMLQQTINSKKTTMRHSING